MKLQVYFFIFFILPSLLNSRKKGVGLSSEFGNEQLVALNVSWYYNWGSNSDFNSSQSDFVPMVFSGRTLKKTYPFNFSHILGFNEPDNENQANLSSSLAFQLWPQIVSKAKSLKPNSALIGSPAMAGSSLREGSWLPIFMGFKPEVDFIAVHWYKGPDAEKFKRDIKNIIDYYNLPVWVTEFAPQTTGSSRENPNKYTQNEINEFIKQTVQWMEKESMVHRYAWHNSKIDGSTSCLFKEDGTLSETGKVYSCS